NVDGARDRLTHMGRCVSLLPLHLGTYADSPAPRRISPSSALRSGSQPEEGAWMHNKSPAPALILDRRTIAALMTPRDYVDAVEAGFRGYAVRESDVPLPMHIPTQRGAFHAKGARLALDRNYVAVKLNGNFPGNPANGLPTIQGVVMLCD